MTYSTWMMDNNSLVDEIVYNNRSVGNLTESLEHLNARYADALLPLTVTFGVFTVLGCTGNLLTLLVFSLSREYRKNNFKIFVITLAMIDFLICTTVIPAEMFKQRRYFAFGDVATCKVKCFFNVSVASASCLALLVISIDRFRQIVQPMRKQLSPRLAIQILIVVAGVCPVILAIPSFIMCGVESEMKTNIYGTKTKVFTCATEERFKSSKLREVYKLMFVILLLCVSFIYIVLYSFVMREVVKQIRSIAKHRKSSAFEIVSSSDTYDPSSVPSPVDSGSIVSPTDHYTKFSDGSVHVNNSNGAVGNRNIHEADRNIASRQPSAKSLRSIKNRIHRIQRYKFPSKTIVWFTLTLVFIVTYVTHILLSLRMENLREISSPSDFSHLSFFYRIYFFNHMVNPLVYLMFVKKFRRSCVNLIPNIRRKLADTFT